MHVDAHYTSVRLLKRCSIAVVALIGAQTGCTSLGSDATTTSDGVALSEGEETDAGEAEGGASDSDTDGSMPPSTSADGSGSGPESTGDDGHEMEAALLPSGIRRLTRTEYQTSIRTLFGVSLPEELGLAPDALQDSFSRNASQRVDPVLAKQLDHNAQWVGEQVRTNIDAFAPCAAAEASCARTFIEDVGARAYRRPLTSDEVEKYLGLFDIGVSSGTYADGIALMVRGLLQSSGFLYLTELGDPGQETTPQFTLTQHEIAAAIASLALGEPPDAELWTAAEAGHLGDPAVRVQQFDRLLARDGGISPSVLSLLREWLGISTVGQIAKDSQVYPQFDGLRAAMDQESLAFLREVLSDAGTLEQLLGAEWTVADPALAQAYGLTGTGRLPFSDPSRRGILNQAAFLSVFAHAHESAPILRGVTILRRLLCYHLASPTTLNLVIVPPLPDPNKTTRERFEVHSADPACASCHTSIDNVGFAFEHFDGMGMTRPGGQENGQPVDTSTILGIGVDVDGPFAHSGELATALSLSEDVRTCFARHMFRAAASRSDEDARDAEDAFIDAWATTRAGLEGHILDTLRAYVEHESFIIRRNP